MLIEKFTADSTATKKIRITEEFAQVLIIPKIPDSGFEGFGKVTAFLERSGKNVEIMSRLSTAKIKTISSFIEGINSSGNETPFIISLFENGNFKSRESDAVILEFNDLPLYLELSVYGIQDFEQCSAVYKYEGKSVLAGDRTKTFSLKGVERVLLPTVGYDPKGQLKNFSEVGFLYRDENGGLVERKMTFEEVVFASNTQAESNPMLQVDHIQKTVIDLVLPVDGLEEIKLYHSEPVITPYELIFQSKYMPQTEFSQSHGNTSLLQNVGTAQIPNLVKVKPASGVFGSPFSGTIKRSF